VQLGPQLLLGSAWSEGRPAVYTSFSAYPQKAFINQADSCHPLTAQHGWRWSSEGTAGRGPGLYYPGGHRMTSSLTLPPAFQPQGRKQSSPRRRKTDTWPEREGGEGRFHHE
jgi:hypothetical protein